MVAFNCNDDDVVVDEKEQEEEGKYAAMGIPLEEQQQKRVLCISAIPNLGLIRYVGRLCRMIELIGSIA